MFGEELPSLDMKYFYECKHLRNISRTLHYIATDVEFGYRQRLCPKTAKLLALKFNRFNKNWSIEKKLLAINTDIADTSFRPISKEDFIYAYNRMLIALSNMDFE